MTEIESKLLDCLREPRRWHKFVILDKVNHNIMKEYDSRVIDNLMIVGSTLQRFRLSDIEPYGLDLGPYGTTRDGRYKIISID